MSAMPFKVLTLNNISVRGLERLPRDRYEVASEIGRPDAILVRSADMHKHGDSAERAGGGRAGAGVNNIPVAALSRRGVPVFNAPGANANAVKELVLAGMFLAARNICPAWAFVRGLAGDDHAVDEAVEKGKKKFVGFELPGRTLGVVGLGAIGVEVANAALALRHEGARLRPADHRAACLAAVVGRGAGGQPRRSVRALRHGDACTCRSTTTRAAS